MPKLNPDDFTREQLVERAASVGASTAGTKAELVTAIAVAEKNFDPSVVEGTVEWERSKFREAQIAQKAVTEAEIAHQQEVAPEVAAAETTVYPLAGATVMDSADTGPKEDAN